MSQAVTIRALYRTGDRRAFVALLSCRHKLTVSDADLKQQQLYIGKRVECAQCQTGELSRTS